MNRCKDWRAAGVMLLALSSAIAGCSQGPEAAAPGTGNVKAEDTKPSPVELKPVELTVLYQTTEADFNKSIAEPLRKVYPHITLNQVTDEVDILISAGQIPDVIGLAQGSLAFLTGKNLLEDLNPLIKKHNFDVNRLRPDVLEGVKSFSSKGEFLYMPRRISGVAMYYNKDIFDKFGVPYPKDNMTWEETVELARKLTRTQDSVMYRGFDMGIPYMYFNNQLSLPFVDPIKETALLDTPGWIKWMTAMNAFYTIPGAELTNENYNKALDGFTKQKTIAMAVQPGIPKGLKDNPGMNFDLVTMPTFKDMPNTGVQLNTPFWAVSTTSKNKDDAFRFISYFLSDEVQTQDAMNDILNIPVLMDPAVLSKLGQNDPAYKGKNVSALYKLKIAPPAKSTNYDALARTALEKALRDVFQHGKDVNTALREAQEAANRAIEAEKKK
jgi:multiple sugar transport system substrate-binding protein